jgi:hypothetical protein
MPGDEGQQAPPPAAEQQAPPPSTGDGTGPNAGDQEKRFTQADLEHQIDERLKRERAKSEAKAIREKEEADAQRLKEQAEWQKLAEANEAKAQKLEAELARRDHDALRARVAAKHKLPEAFAARLVGQTEDELEADARELAKVVTAATPAAPGNGPGPKPAGGGESGPDAAIIEQKRSKAAYTPF